MRTRKRILLGGAGGIACCALLAIGGGTASAATAVLHGVQDSTRWSGSVSNNVVPSPDACSPSACPTTTIDVRVPRSTWSRSPGGLIVAVKWPEEQLDLGYDLDVYVYGTHGSLAAKSDNLQYSSDEAAWVQNPKSGTYRVVIVPRIDLGQIDYRAYAGFERGYTLHQDRAFLGMQPDARDLVAIGRRPARPKPLLPDLDPVDPYNFHMDTGFAASFYVAFNRGLGHQPSCYPQETLGLTQDDPTEGPTGAVRCLRFDSSLDNTGAGPYEMRAYPDNGNGTDAYQVVYRSDGTYTETKVGDAIFSNAHGHIHFLGFEKTGLYAIRPDGSPGRELAEMPDKGRCALDTQNARFGRPGDAPARYIFPSTCDAEDNQDPNDPVYPGANYFRSGISAGWEDTYPWFIPDQYIDVTDVPDGRYLVIERVNLDGRVAELDRSNDTAVSCVRIEGDTASSCPVPPASAAALR